MVTRHAGLSPGVLWAGAAVAIAHRHEVRPAAGVEERGPTDAAAPRRFAGRLCLQLGMPPAEIPARVPSFFQLREEV